MSLRATGVVQVAQPPEPQGSPHMGEIQGSAPGLYSPRPPNHRQHLERCTMTGPQAAPAEEPDGGNLQVRIRRGPGLGNRPGLLDKGITVGGR